MSESGYLVELSFRTLVGSTFVFDGYVVSLVANVVNSIWEEPEMSFVEHHVSFKSEPLLFPIVNVSLASHWY